MPVQVTAVANGPTKKDRPSLAILQSHLLAMVVRLDCLLQKLSHELVSWCCQPNYHNGQQLDHPGSSALLSIDSSCIHALATI